MKPSKCGRPKKTVIDALKTLFWYEYVSEKVYLSCVQRNEQLTDNEIKNFRAGNKRLDSFFDQEGSNTWYKYSIMKISPSHESLKLVDYKIQGASTYFQHPIWSFLEDLPRGNMDVDQFYYRLDRKTREILEIGEVKCGFNFTYQDTNDYQKFENLLEFYSCILYQYYKAKFAMNNMEAERCYFYFSRNTNHIIDKFGATGYYFLKILKLHLKLPSNQVTHQFSIESNLNNQDLLKYMLTASKKFPKRYEKLEKDIADFKLDGTQYKKDNLYILIDDLEGLNESI